MALFAGHKYYKQFFKRVATQSLLGYLDNAFGSGTIVYLDADKASHKVFSGRSAQVGQIPSQKASDDEKFEVVLGPVDGARSLALGSADGSVSVLVGGEKGSLAPDLTSWPSHCVILAFRPSWRASCNLNQSGSISSTEWLTKVCNAVLGTGDEECILGMLGHDNGDQRILRETLLANTKLRPALSFCGSSVAAALAVYTGRSQHDVFAAVVRSAHAAMIAVAAKATGGKFYCIKLKDNKKDKSAHFEPDELTVFHADELAPGDDLFLVATGITDGPTLQGVRFRGKTEASTHTLCLHSHSKSLRWIQADHNLEKRIFQIRHRRGVEHRSFEDILEELPRFLNSEQKYFLEQSSEEPN